MADLLAGDLPLLHSLKNKFPKDYDDVVSTYYDNYVNGTTEAASTALTKVKILSIIATLRPLADDDFFDVGNDSRRKGGDVHAAGGGVTGQLVPYRDPECDCQVATRFEGRIHGDTIEGTYTAGTILIYEHDSTAGHRVTCIFLNDGVDASAGKDVCVRPGDPAWDLAKLYLLQGAAYHVQFVVHPALHFPMDAVNAITKSAVPVTHPLLQLLLPHSGYQLPLDHAVLESAESLVRYSSLTYAASSGNVRSTLTMPSRRRVNTPSAGVKGEITSSSATSPGA
jgi:hypothetical protein